MTDTSNTTNMKTISFRIPHELEMKLYRTMSELTKTTPSVKGMATDIVRHGIERECNRILRKLKKEKGVGK